MAEEHQDNRDQLVDTPATEEVKDRGLFDFIGKKAAQEEVMAAEFEEKVNISEAEEKPKVEEDGSLVPKLQPSDRSSSSTSSSDEEEGGGDENNKEKLDDEAVITAVDHAPPHHPPEVVVESPSVLEEKKGFLERIKEKLPGRYNKPPAAEEVVVIVPAAAEPAPSRPAVSSQVVEQKEKKGLLEKIKEKLPGYHPKTKSVEEDKHI